jgi:uncharacterized membrane protein (TIGR02234 family)
MSEASTPHDTEGDTGTRREACTGRDAGAQNRREYALALVIGAVGAGLIWLALREQWAQAVFTQPKPLPQETVGVSGAALSPLAGALAIAALACLAVVIATRGIWRRGVGVVLALFGAGAGAAVTAAVSAASVVSTAASQVGSPGTAAMSGTAPGSTTSGASSSNSALVVAGSVGHAVMSGTEWRFAVMAGALLILAAGLMTLMHGQDWPVMSSRYELPQRRAAGKGASDAGELESHGSAEGESDDDEDAAPGRPRDSASMWESLSGGDDPTEVVTDRERFPA